MNARRTDLTTAEELRSILADELGGGEGAAMNDLLVRHREQAAAAVRQATRNLSVRVVDAAAPRVASRRGWMAAAGAATAVVAVIMIVRSTDQPTEQVVVAHGPATQPVAAVVAPEVTPVSNGAASIRPAEQRRPPASPQVAPATVDLDAMADDALVASLASGLAVRETWTVADADVDILLEESSDGL